GWAAARGGARGAGDRGGAGAGGGGREREAETGAARGAPQERQGGGERRRGRRGRRGGRRNRRDREGEERFASEGSHGTIEPELVDAVADFGGPPVAPEDAEPGAPPAFEPVAASESGGESHGAESHGGESHGSAEEPAT